MVLNPHPVSQLPDSKLVVLSCGSWSGAPIYPTQPLPFLPVHLLQPISPLLLARESKVNESAVWKRSSTCILNKHFFIPALPLLPTPYPCCYAQIYLIPKQPWIANAWKVLLNFTQLLHIQTSSVQSNSIFCLEKLSNNKTFINNSLGHISILPPFQSWNATNSIFGKFQPKWLKSRQKNSTSWFKPLKSGSSTHTESSSIFPIIRKL